MNLRENSKSNRQKYLLALLAVSLIEIVTHWGVYVGDSVQLYQIREAFLGERSFSSISPFFVVRPAIPFLASLLPFYARTSFAFINAVLWLALVYVFFRFSKMLLYDTSSAFYSTFFLSCALPLLLAGISTDLAGLFFLALSCYLIVRYDKSQSLNSSILIGATIGIGLLTREILFTALLFFVLYEFSKKERHLSRVLLVGVISVVPITLWIYSLGLGKPYISHWLHVLSYYKGTEMSTFHAFLTSIFYAFPLCIFAFPGFIEEEDKDKLRFQYSYLIATLFFVAAWPYYHLRLTFILFPSVIPLSVKGLRWFARKTSEKPVLRLIKPIYWELITLILYIAFTNKYGLRYVAFPW